MGLLSIKKPEPEHTESRNGDRSPLAGSGVKGCVPVAQGRHLVVAEDLLASIQKIVAEEIRAAFEHEATTRKTWVNYVFDKVSSFFNRSI